MPKNSHRLKKTAAEAFSVKQIPALTQLPPLYDLPEKLDMVKHHAFCQGILDAFAAWPKHPQFADVGTIEVMAIEAYQGYLRQVVEGKVGTNDYDLFVQTFLPWYVRIFPAATRVFERKPLAYKILLMMSVKRRVTWCLRFAEKHCAEIEALPSDEVIMLDW